MNYAVQLIGQHPALQDKRRNYAAVLGCDYTTPTTTTVRRGEAMQRESPLLK